MPTDTSIPARQDFRAHQRNEFLAAVAAASHDPDATLTIETDADGNTVAIIHGGSVADQVQPPTPPINPLCRADVADDVIYMAQQAVTFVRDVQLMTDDGGSPSRSESKEGVVYVLSMVRDAMEFAQKLVEHERAASQPKRKAVKS
jgi:hypothetical protein